MSFAIYHVLDLKGLEPGAFGTPRYKVGRLEQLETSEEAEARGANFFLLIEVKEDGSHFTSGNLRVVEKQSALYVVFLPIIEGDFRTVLQGNSQDGLEICVESGDPAVGGFEGTNLVYVAAGSDPFDVIANVVKSIKRHLQTFSHRERKKMPDMLNWFGWCTWYAFYTDVIAEGVGQGLESMKKGGIHPKFVIIDDGWQSVGMDPAGTEFISGNSAKSKSQWFFWEAIWDSYWLFIFCC
ncbi:hypothetical protein Droror1_Dr00022772 [Drosera rotundifolia]